MTPFLESQAEKTSLGLWVSPLWREADSCGSHFSFSATCVSVIKLWWSGSVARAFILLPEPPDLPQITSFQQRNSENRSSTWGRSRNCAVCYETSAHCRPSGSVSKSEATLQQSHQCGPLWELQWAVWFLRHRKGQKLSPLSSNQMRGFLRTPSGAFLNLLSFGPHSW